MEVEILPGEPTTAEEKPIDEWATSAVVKIPVNARIGVHLLFELIKPSCSILVTGY